MNFPVRKILSCVFVVLVVGGLGVLVACGTRFPGPAGTHKVGYIYYSDGFAYPQYFGNKTAIGIVVEVNSNGYASKIVGLQEVNRQWGESNEAGNSEALSASEGWSNTNIIKESATNLLVEFPAFDYCINYGSTHAAGGTWYLPAINELELLYENFDAIQVGLNAITDSGLKASIQNERYWSSTKDAGGANAMAWNVLTGSIEAVTKTTELLVRPFRKVR